MLRYTKIWILLYSLVFMISVPQTASAMHIMEGFLQPTWCIVWGVICVPSLFMGVGKINSLLNKNKQAIILLAMACAFTFVLSALKIPSVTGSSSHMTGLGLPLLCLGQLLQVLWQLLSYCFKPCF